MSRSESIITFFLDTATLNVQNLVLSTTKGLPTPPGSLNRKRRDSTDSPRTITRKTSGNALSHCISGHISEAESTYTRVDSPELPAVHFMNVKSPTSPPVQNAMFHDLKKSDSNSEDVDNIRESNITAGPQNSQIQDDEIGREIARTEQLQIQQSHQGDRRGSL